MLYTGLAYALMAAWGIFTQATAGTQPLVASTVIGAGSNIYKLQQLFPPGPSESGGASGKPLTTLSNQSSQVQRAVQVFAGGKGNSAGNNSSTVPCAAAQHAWTHPAVNR